MRRSSPAPIVNWAARVLSVTVFLAIGTAANAQVVGPNVNMVGGPASFVAPSTLIGDPFLQRQNEPSIAVSSRNPCHLLAGANDYRAVDVEQAAGETGDAWLGVFKSFDCGATWTSTLLPGHLLDATPEGLNSPIHGLNAAADPTVRAGTSGLFYYSGIAFNRGDNGIGKVFVSRFIDNNNKDGGDPIQYGGSVVIDTGTSGQFLDKPWLVADVPRGNATCTINGRTVPAGPVYLLYTSFVGGDNNIHSKIMFTRSTDCGVTWSQSSKLSESVARNQGTTIAIDPGTGAIHVAWREFAVAGDKNSKNSIIVARSTDGGQTFTKAAAVTPNGYTFVPFDQPSSAFTFRTNAYPTIAVVPAEAEGRAAGEPGRVYLAFAARGFDATRPNDSRIVISTSLDGATWSTPKKADASTNAGHQIMPSLAFAGGKLALAFYDLRDDRAGSSEDFVFEYGQTAYNQCVATGQTFTFSSLVACMLANPNGLTRRHTLDMRAAMADADCLAGGTCGFVSTSLLGDSAKVSRYPVGRGQKGTGPKTQLQYNRPDLPLFSGGKFPFLGDYIDIAGQSFVATDNGGWAWNTGRTANRPAPVFHVSWSDNRNVGSPKDANWEHFTPAVLGPGAVMCVPGQVGIRNQDVYTAELRPELVVASPQNSKRISGLQRSFAVIAQNTTDQDRSYVMRITAPSGVIASFDQFGGFDGTSAARTELTLRIPRKSTASRTVFVGLVDVPSDPNAAPDVLVPVTVDEIVTNPLDASSDMVYLNPDFENPDFENPDFENTELHNPDFENPDFENPDFENPDFENFTLTADSSIRNPDFENPDFENPDFENPDFENPDFENPDFENPDFENPDFENPDFENPDFENPDFENPDFENGAYEVADTTWPVRNNGNTTSAYKTNVYVNEPPDGVKFQLAIRKIYTSPAASCAVDSTPAQTAQSVPLVNIIGPDVQANPFNRDFNDPSRENATFTLAPGERGIITLRAYCPLGTNCSRGLLASLKDNIALGVVAQGANCARCAGGACTNTDLVAGATECRIDDGPPKDVYDPIPPTEAVVTPALSADNAIVVSDTDNSGSESVSFTVAAHDNVAIGSVVCASTATAVQFVSASGDSYAFNGSFPVGTNTVSCVASDVRSNPGPNTATLSFDVTVRDVTPPSFDLSGGDPGSPFAPGNPAEATSAAGAVVAYTNPTATDTNPGQVTVVCASDTGLQSGSTFPIGTTPINCVATDVSGQSTPSTNLFSIAVRDTTPPAITINAPTASVEGNTLGGATVAFSASASDAVSGPVATNCTPASGSTFPVGTTNATCTATDGAGNVGTQSVPVTVVDTTAPAITVNGPAAITIEGGSAYIEQGASAADIVSGTLAVAISGGVNSMVPGTYTVTYRATDAAGNTSTASRTVTVVDTTPPTVTVGGPGSPIEGNTLGGATVVFTSSASDTVSGSLSTTCLPASGSLFPVGTTSVVCTATDGAGLTGTKSFTINVVDTTAPAITLNGSATMTIEGGTSYVEPGATASDIVSGGVAVTISGAVNTSVLGTYTLTYRAADAAGNVATMTRTVTVVDTTAPVVTDAASPNILLWSPNKTMTPVTISGTVTDVSLSSTTYQVVDEYGLVQPSGTVAVGANGGYSFVIKLEAYRNGNDANGRLYTVKVTARDAGGRATTAVTYVTVPHNQ